MKASRLRSFGFAGRDDHQGAARRPSVSGVTTRPPDRGELRRPRPLQQRHPDRERGSPAKDWQAHAGAQGEGGSGSASGRARDPIARARPRVQAPCGGPRHRGCGISSGVEHHDRPSVPIVKAWPAGTRPGRGRSRVPGRVRRRLRGAAPTRAGAAPVPSFTDASHRGGRAQRPFEAERDELANNLVQVGHLPAGPRRPHDRPGAGRPAGEIAIEAARPRRAESLAQRSPKASRYGLAMSGRVLVGTSSWADPGFVP